MTSVVFSLFFGSLFARKKKFSWLKPLCWLCFTNAVECTEFINKNKNMMAEPSDKCYEEPGRKVHCCEFCVSEF